MKRHLQCAGQQKSASNFSKYCTCHAKCISWLIRLTYETSFTTRGATRVSLQLQQILRLPRKMNLMIDPPHIWNVIYNARSNKSQPPTSANTAPATQNESHDWSSSHMTSPNVAPATKSHTPPSANTAPVTTTILYGRLIYSLLLYSLRIYCLLIYSLRIYSLRIYSLVYSLRIYSLRIYSLRIYSLSIYSLSIYSLRFSKHLFSKHLFSLIFKAS